MRETQRRYFSYPGDDFVVFDPQGRDVALLGVKSGVEVLGPKHSTFRQNSGICAHFCPTRHCIPLKPKFGTEHPVFVQ